MRQTFWQSVLLLASVLPAIASNARAAGCRMPEISYAASEKRDLSQKELQRMADQYQNFFKALCEKVASQDTKGVIQCCAGSSGDAIANNWCTLTEYLANGRKDSARLLASIPKSHEGIEAIFELNRFDIGDDSNIQPICGSAQGPTDLYLDELFRLVEKGNKMAIESFVGISNQAEGDNGEYMQLQSERLLREQPRVAIENWSVFRQSLLMQTIYDDLPAKKCESMLKGVIAICDSKDRSHSCSEMEQICKQELPWHTR